MRILITALCLILSSLALAETKGFEIQLNEVSVNGAIDGQPRKVKVSPNQTIVISKAPTANGVNTIVEMKVRDDNSLMKDGILISLTVIEEKDGLRKVIGTPQMIIKSGHTAHMTQGKIGESASIKASLTGTRIE